MILSKGPTQGLNDTILTAEKEHSVNFTEQTRKFCLSLYYNEINSCLFVCDIEIYKFTVKNSEINLVPLCLGNVSKDISTDNMKKTGLYRYVNDFSVDYDSIDIANILEIQKYLMVMNKVK